MRKSTLFPALVMCSVLCTVSSLVAQDVRQPSGAKMDAETISGLGARNIGSAAMSGRIAALDAVWEGERLTVYVGAASGGVWKSVNGGTTFKPVFDKQPVQSIGAVTVDPSNPKVVWVGTGESWTRNSVSIGDGIYRSTDGGENWVNLGLKNSERIAKILVDPTDSKTVYAAVPGKLWSDSDERGVYKTTDAGTTWSLVLKGPNPSTGSSMIALDPKNPKTIFAGMWDFRRKGWTFRSGGDSAGAPSGSGLFRSTDGGGTWTDLTGNTSSGLPSKPWGRVAVATAPSKSGVVYAFIEAEPPKNGLYRSDDGGNTWQALDRSQSMVWRPFYFANLIVDPKDENRLYKPDGPLIVSTNGGRSFSGISGGAHGDFHDVWIDPLDTNHVITGDDGGLWISHDAGNKWWKVENLPISQFYHVSTDMDRPYRVYGGLQDNSSWVGLSYYPGGIANSQWENMYGGDGFWMFADPADPDYVYAEAQGGNVARINRKTHEIRDIQPLPHYKEGKLRFNWNTPIHVSPTRKGVVYIGAQFLFRSTDHGHAWERISPDLTTNNPAKQRQEQSGGVTVDNSAAEMHTTIYAIAESPRDPKIIWVGTDDGNIQVTRNGGKEWRNVAGNIRGLAKDAWIASVEPGHFAEATAYVTVDYHMSGDMRPYAYRTTDFGQSWAPLVNGESSAVRGYAHVIKEDLVNRNLLFLGTEFGLWISLDGGKQWAQFKGGDLPNVAVHDLVVHPRDHDLVVATHGRGIWIVDDISPLRSLTPEVLDREIDFIDSRPVVQRISAWGGWAHGDAAFIGPNSPDDAVITYYQKRRHIFGDLRMEVFDSGGKSLGTIPSSKRRGLNRATWSMRMKPPRVPTGATGAGGTNTGPRLLPGSYTVKLTKNSQVYAQKLNVVPDPRAAFTLEDQKAHFDLILKVYALLENMTVEVDRINALRAALDDRAAKLTAGDTLVTRLHALSAQADEFRKKVVATKEGGAITGEERLREFAAGLYSSLNGYEGRPSQTQIERAEALAKELSDLGKDFTAWAGAHVPGVNAGLQRNGMEPVQLMTRGDWEKSRPAQATSRSHWTSSRLPQQEWCTVGSAFQLRPFGSTGINVTPLGLSASYFPGKNTVYAAAEEGINLFFSYGFDVQMTRALREIFPSGRNKYVLVTGAYNYVWRAQDVRKAYEKRLRQFRTDYIDVFLFMGVMKPAEFRPEIREELLKLKEEGKVRAIGLSGHNREFLGKLAANGDVNALMLRYNAAHRGAERDIFPHLPRHNPGVISYTATRWTALLRRPKGLPKNARIPTAGECYRFVLSNPNVHAVLTAPRNGRQLRENIAAAQKGPLDDDEMKFMRDFGDAVYHQRKWFM